jgi:hypothetical protein
MLYYQITVTREYARHAISLGLGDFESQILSPVAGTGPDIVSTT